MRPTLGTDLESADEILLEILDFEIKLNNKLESTLESESNIGSIPDIGAFDTWLFSFPELHYSFQGIFERYHKSSP